MSLEDVVNAFNSKLGLEERYPVTFRSRLGSGEGLSDTVVCMHVCARAHRMRAIASYAHAYDGCRIIHTRGWDGVCTRVCVVHVGGWMVVLRGEVGSGLEVGWIGVESWAKCMRV